jgi:6-phospho-3-hexuloisomerase
MKSDHKAALSEISTVLDGVVPDSVDKTCHMIAKASTVLLYGCGREGLQMRGLAMRLYHLGINASMVADMAAPPLGKGDLFAVSAGPGELSTVTALMNVAKRDGADVLFFTAMPDAKAASLADHVVNIPAQTMANDQGEARQSILPMGSIYEGSMFILFEMMILELQGILKVNANDMRARHTNME